MIYSVNVKTNVMFNVIKSLFNLTAEQMHDEVINSFNYFKSLLLKANINYDDLRNVLVPNAKKKEICLVFDTLNIEESCYGIKILNDLLPYFDKQKRYNILFGDLLDYSKHKKTDTILDIMCDACNIQRVDEHRFANRYFLVYINNLSDSDFNVFANSLKSLPYFVGHADMTFSGVFKSYVSNCISSGLLLVKNKAICAHEPDLEDIDSINTIGLDFEDHGYDIVSLSSDYFSLFLDYLIDSNISVWKIDEEYKELMSDIIGHDCDLKNFSIDIPDAKIDYIIKHAKLQSRLGNPKDLKNTLQSIVSFCIKQNIFYELDFDQLEYDIIKFNVYADIDRSKKIKCVVKYNISKRLFEVITMY